MDYKEKYEQALNRAKTFNQRWEGIEINSELALQELKEIFPELKESEDEKVRKELIRAFTATADKREREIYGNGITYGQVLAWLEKQGEQKPTDKIEPKFKAGDIIINEYGFIMQIDGIDDNMYVYHILDGNVLLKHDITKTDESCHLWTIQDAKDGDILVTESRPFIFRSFFDKYHPKHPVAYCGIDSTHKFHISSDKNKYWTRNSCLPSTEEQRNLLFLKMKEVGYEWDSEKKKLKEEA